MEEINNPYNCDIPGNLFVGREPLRNSLLKELRNRSSVAVFGGRRCGKTSLLYQMQKDLCKSEIFSRPCLPIYIDSCSLENKTPSSLFETIFNEIILNIQLQTWSKPESDHPYRSFQLQLEKVIPSINQKVGENWLVILLWDEFDAVTTSNFKGQFMGNLRNFLTASVFKDKFRLVATGGKELENELGNYSSPLFNILTPFYLKNLNVEESQKLVNAGFPDGMTSVSQTELFHITGKHPYLMQKLLKTLWFEKGKLNQEILKKIVKKELFHPPYSFKNWWYSFGDAGKTLYSLLIKAPQEKLSIQEISKQLPSKFVQEREEACNVLIYHGVIEEIDEDYLCLIGTMFRDWVIQRGSTIEEIGNEFDVFFCYNSQDRLIVKYIVEKLEKRGVRVWWDKGQLKPGNDWLFILQDKLPQFQTVYVFLGEKIGNTQHKEILLCQHENINRKCNIIPVYLSNFSEKTLDNFSFLKTLTPVDTRKMEEEPLNQLLEGIKNSN